MSYFWTFFPILIYLAFLCFLGYLFYLVCKLIKAWIDKLNRD